MSTRLDRGKRTTLSSNECSKIEFMVRQMTAYVFHLCSVIKRCVISLSETITSCPRTTFSF